MALSNAERQRRFRENRRIKAALVDTGQADIAAAYEALRKQWLLHEDEEGDSRPAERAYREQLASMPVGMRAPGERLERIEELFLNMVGSIIERSYSAQIHGKRRIDRKERASLPAEPQQETAP